MIKLQSEKLVKDAIIKETLRVRLSIAVKQLNWVIRKRTIALSFLYNDGYGVERDMAQRLHHLEEAAIGGQPEARHNLGVYEINRRKIKRGVKHFIIAASHGNSESMKALKELRAAMIICQEDFESTLRTHQAVLDASNSPQREAAFAAMQFLTLSRRVIHENKPREDRESEPFYQRHNNETSTKNV